MPAEELAEFNRHIVGEIRVVEVFTGDRYRGEVDRVTKLPLELSSGGAGTHNRPAGE